MILYLSHLLRVDLHISITKLDIVMILVSLGLMLQDLVQFVFALR